MKVNETKLIELRERVLNEPDFINSRKHKHSLREYRRKNQDKGPATDNVIAYFLCIEPQDVQAIYESAAQKIRQHFKITV